MTAGICHPPIIAHSLVANKNYTGWIIFIHLWMTALHIIFILEKESKRTSNRILERKGYYPYKVDEEVARYKLHEKFMGLDATEIAIPSNTYAIHMITVPVNVKRLAAAIKKTTGYQLAIAAPGFNPQSGVAYLVEEGKNKSSFVCITSDEGGF